MVGGRCWASTRDGLKTHWLLKALLALNARVCLETELDEPIRKRKAATAAWRPTFSNGFYSWLGGASGSGNAVSHNFIRRSCRSQIP